MDRLIGTVWPYALCYLVCTMMMINAMWFCFSWMFSCLTRSVAEQSKMISYRSWRCIVNISERNCQLFRDHCIPVQSKSKSKAKPNKTNVMQIQVLVQMLTKLKVAKKIKGSISTKRKANMQIRYFNSKSQDPASISWYQWKAKQNCKSDATSVRKYSAYPLIYHDRKYSAYPWN